MRHPDDLIEVERRCLVETNNVMHVWAAYGFARAAGVPIPEWVLRYFDKAGHGLMALAVEAKKQGGKDFGPRIAKAFGLATAGSGSPLTAYHSAWMTFGMNVRYRMQQGDKEYLAIASVARDGGVSDATVRRAHELFDKLFPGDGIFPDEALE